MRERLALAVERYDAGDTTSELNTINSWVQRVREVFDLMPTQGEEAAANIAKRMAAVPRAYRQLSETLLDAARNGRSAARRQVEEVAGQCAAWAKPVGFHNSATGADLGFYVARSYSLMRPPRMGRRLIRSRERPATGWSGRGGRSWRLRCGRHPL
jgi:hypothetical protein